MASWFDPGDSLGEFKLEDVLAGRVQGTGNPVTLGEHDRAAVPVEQRKVLISNDDEKLAWR
jgi:hypothetical protein